MNSTKKELIAVFANGNVSTIHRLKQEEPVAQAYGHKHSGLIHNFVKIKEAKRAQLRFYASET